MRRGAAVTVALALVLAALPGTNWTAAVDPALAPGEYALIQVEHGAAPAIAAKAGLAGATDVSALSQIDLVTARLSGEALRALRADRRVAFLVADGEVSAVGKGRQFEHEAGRQSPGVAVVEAPRAWPTSTGRGVTVALMDTGVAEHPDLAGSVVARQDFVRDGATELDPSGHGTFVAGLIAAHGRTFKGVAPDAKLVSLRVLDQNGDGRMHSVLAAFDWLLHNRTAYHVGVLNLSFGARQTTSYHRQLLAGVVESAWFAGIAVVAAAGNDGPNAGTVSMPGADPFVITAGSLADQGTVRTADDRESLFSSRGPTRDGFAKPDVLAPGEHVLSLRVPGTALDRDDRGSGNGVNPSAYAQLSGTSAASAMVAGVAALVLGARPYTPTLVKGALVAGARHVAGTPTGAADAVGAIAARPARVNAAVMPSLVLLRLLVVNGQISSGVNWDGISWEGISWDSVAWEGITWEAVSWESVSWETASWESVAWEGLP
ncbi:MAG TPA: S8 family serine peptidase [Candidatus Limnocylindria bacterium]|nr:S8 family serine peptidase [Candidatus Limnocylindria bacterium]